MKFFHTGLISIALILAGCASMTGVGKDNSHAPSSLLNFKYALQPQKVWSVNAGKGTHSHYLNFIPEVNGDRIFTADYKGNVTAINIHNGKIFWQRNLKTSLVAGPAVDSSVVLVGGKQADLYALNQVNGNSLWHIYFNNPISAVPGIFKGIAIVKTLDGQLWALDVSHGSVIWNYDHPSPLMILAGGSRPEIIGDRVIIGYPDGKLAAFTLSKGKQLWMTNVADPQGASDVEQMIDIVADSQISGNVIYVVTYQGNLAAINATNGSILWQQPLSSYSGLALSSDQLFVTDANGVVSAFNRRNGKHQWSQESLKYRRLTAPAVMNGAIVVGDGEGYLHWLSQENSLIVGRVSVSNAPIMATPVVFGNNVYVLDTNGIVSNYRLP